MQKLSPEKAQEKTILHELAFNDDDTNVSLAALEKLNCFALWLKMSQIAKENRVKKIADKKVNDALVGDATLLLTQSEKAAFLLENANVELVVKLVPQMLKQDKALFADDEVVNKLIEKVNRPSFTQFVFLEVASETLRTALINGEADVGVLQKLAKKVSDSALKETIESRINAIHSAIQKPIELKKKLTLGLSKYQALLDKTDVDFIDTQQREFKNTLSGLFEQSNLLKEEEKTQFELKYSRIVEQVERYLNRLRPAWEEQQQRSVLNNTKALCEQQLTHAIEQVNWLYNARLCDATLADVATVNESVRAVEATLEELARQKTDSGFDKRRGEIEQRLASLNEKLDGFSLQQQYSQKLLVTLQKLEEIAQQLAVALETHDLESDNVMCVLAEFEEAKHAFAVQRDDITLLPKEMAKRFNRVTKQVAAIKRTGEDKVNAQVQPLRKQISVVDNLILQGKFRLALGKFKKAEASYLALPSAAKKQLQKRFEKAASDVSRLEGWQDYLAKPRKPALIEEAQKLANTPVDNIKERSEAIKYLRNQWLSLSSVTNSEKAETDALQDAFDNALARAFEPCRAYYAKQDEERAEALNRRKAIIQDISALNDDMSPLALAKAFDRLSKQWHNAGQVERDIYDALRQEWKTVSSPIRNKVAKWHNDNQLKKQALVTQAQRLIDAEDVADAADKAQMLQRQWKLIGHAGIRDESKLWADFKRANDAVFSRLKEDKKAQQSVVNEQVDVLLEKVTALDVSANEAVFTAAVDEIKSGLVALPKAQRNKVERQLDSVINKRGSLAKNEQANALKVKAQAMADLLKVYSGEEGDEQALLTVLGKRWSPLMSQVEKSDIAKRDRRWLTAALEVATDMPSPPSEASIRTNVQLEMMTAKLERGEAVSATDYLSDWLSYDAISESDIDLTKRVVTVLGVHPEVLA